jgi:hypothetical protein
MTLADIINTIGVSLILVAFFLLTLKKISSTNNLYNVLNIAGAGLAGIGAYMIGAIPFVVLESIWCAVAVYGLIKKK